MFASLSTQLRFCFFATNVPLLMVEECINPAKTVGKILRPRSDNSLATVPSQIPSLPAKIIANVLSVYANHLPKQTSLERLIKIGPL